MVAIILKIAGAVITLPSVSLRSTAPLASEGRQEKAVITKFSVITKSASAQIRAERGACGFCDRSVHRSTLLSKNAKATMLCDVYPRLAVACGG